MKRAIIVGLFSLKESRYGSIDMDEKIIRTGPDYFDLINDFNVSQIHDVIEDKHGVRTGTKNLMIKSHEMNFFF